MDNVTVILHPRSTASVSMKVNDHHTFKKRMDGYFSDILRLLKNGKKPNSFAAHFEHHFNATTSCKDLRKYMVFKVVKQINPIG